MVINMLNTPKAVLYPVWQHLKHEQWRELHWWPFYIYPSSLLAMLFCWVRYCFHLCVKCG